MATLCISAWYRAWLHLGITPTTPDRSRTRRRPTSSNHIAWQQPLNALKDFFEHDVIHDANYPSMRDTNQCRKWWIYYKDRRCIYLRYPNVIKSGKACGTGSKKASESCPALEQCRRCDSTSPVILRCNSIPRGPIQTKEPHLSYLALTRQARQRIHQQHHRRKP